MYKIENEINIFTKKYFDILTIGYARLLEKKENEKIDFVKNNNDINIITNNKINNTNSITFIKSKYYKRQKINILHRFKYFFIFYKIILFY